ncbi:MAG: acyltransferase [Gammaproteobacteria bacterium]|nr:MAG: acyltransferase [Gammaproteobacteria bacterium]
MRLLTGILSTALVVSNLIINSIPLFLMTLLRVIVRVLGLKQVESRVARWMDLVIDSWVVINRFTFRTLGLARIEVSWEGNTDLAKDRWYLVVSNHQSWTDIFMLQTQLYDALPPLKFFTKRQLLYIPIFGQAMWALDFPYVRRMSRAQIEANPALLEVDRQAILTACEKFKNHPTTALNFLEGTRFTTEKYGAQDAPRFQHLLNPKSGGVTQVLAALSDRLDKLVDVTINYPEGVPSFWEFMQGRCSRVTMHIQNLSVPASITDASDEEARRAAVSEWVEALWQAKDARLDRTREVAN